MLSPTRQRTLLVATLVLFVGWQLAIRVPTEAEEGAVVAQDGGEKFVFQVFESFDAKYAGDTPGHIGKGGGLGKVTPHVSLGDPVFRGEERIGSVTTVIWDRGRDSLTIEFDPEPKVRVSVGDTAWVKFHPPGNVAP